MSHFREAFLAAVGFLGIDGYILLATLEIFRVPQVASHGSNHSIFTYYLPSYILQQGRPWWNQVEEVSAIGIGLGAWFSISISLRLQILSTSTVRWTDEHLLDPTSRWDEV